jgi:hypothetical protein
MIEKEYDSFVGFEDKDIYVQKDIFEIAESRNTGLQHLFHLSTSPNSWYSDITGSSTFYPGTVEQNRPDLMVLPSFRNLNFNAGTGFIGDRYGPGWSGIILDGQIFNTFNNVTDVKNYFDNISVPDVHGIDDFGLPKENTTINWNKNAIVKLDYYTQGAYGEFSYNEIYNFRSGYFEFVVKTDNQNCVIASGDSEFKNNFVDNAEIDLRTQESEQAISTFNSSESYIDKYKIDKAKLNIEIVDGKLALIYKNINSEYNFNLIGNQNIADNEWHHIVINIGRPGTTRVHGKKFNKDFIEFWVDAELDYRDNEILTNNKIIFPTVDFLLGDINTFMTAELPDSWESADLESYWSKYQEFNNSPLAPENRFGFKSTSYSIPSTGNFELNRLINHVFTNTFKQSAFSGIINYWIFGLNTSINKYEIQQRYRLWRGFEKSAVDKFTANALMVNPSVLTNSKKALKLYWNNVDENKFGLELDNTYQVNTYSVTHKTFNSVSEIYNLDLSNKIQFKPLSDVRLIIKDNLWIYGPGKYPRFGNINSHANHSGIQRDPRSLFQYNKLFMEPLSKEPSYIEDDWGQGLIQNIMYGGLELKDNDRILLVGQIDKSENGIYLYKGIGNSLVRALDADSASKINNGLVRIIDGYYKDTSWFLSNTIESFDNDQNWRELEYHPQSNDLGIQPHFKSRWFTSNGEERLINLEEDININNYDLIVFMNYPETNQELRSNFIGYGNFEIDQKYKDFIESIKNVVAQGANLYVSSPRLARDLGIVKGFTEINQLLESEDLQSASINPFEINEPTNRYFDTHRIMSYHLDTEVAGLTDKETYVLTDFINYLPENVYDYEEYHAKYSYRPLGLKEGNEFIIPGLAIRKITESDKLPGYRGNYRGTKPIMAVALNDIITGTVVTSLQNNYYNGSTITANPYDDYATTIIVHNGQLLGTQPVTGKIFVNCVEDAYTFSRDEYNKARIQVIPQNEVNENTNTRAFQYSTRRLNRLPRRINVTELTENGQTTPTNGGGGPFIQATSNASYGVIRSETDKGNRDFQSDLYPTEAEEIYPIQEIPVLSMTWLGLQWLTG